MKPRTEAQIEADRRRCLNGERKMTPEERRERKKLYMARVLADPFRRKQYAEYFRKRRARPGMREKTNEQARERYHRNVEESRERGREKYRRYAADKEKSAKRNAARHARRYGPDGKPTERLRIELIKYRLIPLWEQVVKEGRHEQYMRRTTEQNRRLFNMWLMNRVLFDEMLKARSARAAR